MKRPYLSVGAIGALLCLAACDRSSTAPSPAATPVAPAAVAPLHMPGYDQLWTLSTLDLGHTGSGCIQRGVADTTVKDGLAVGRDGSTMKLLYWVRNYPTDDVDYVATLDASGAFSGQTSIQPMMFPGCASHGTFQGTLVGQLSPDGRHIDATETWTYQFPDGTQQLHIQWTADRDQ